MRPDLFSPASQVACLTPVRVWPAGSSGRTLAGLASALKHLQWFRIQAAVTCHWLHSAVPSPSGIQERALAGRAWCGGGWCRHTWCNHKSIAGSLHGVARGCRGVEEVQRRSWSCSVLSGAPKQAPKPRPVTQQSLAQHVPPRRCTSGICRPPARI